MSYDVYLVQDKYKSNYTSNVCKMLQAAFEQLQREDMAPTYYTHWSEPMVNAWDDGKGRTYLRALIKELKAYPEKYEPLQPQIDPKTGERWGSYETCIKWLEEILSHWKEGYRMEIDK